MIAFADLVFDTIGTVFAAVGVVIVALGLGFALYLGRFHSRAGDVRARVVAHENQRTEADKDSGKERRLHQPVFELADGPDAGARHTSSEVQTRNAYPIGTLWPAKYDPVSGAIRTDRALTAWPFICIGILVTGLAFIIVPALPLLDGETALPVAFVVLGLGLIACGIIAHFARQRSGPRSLEVMAKLVAIEIRKDTDRADYEAPIMRIENGPYAGVECGDVNISDFCEDDIGEIAPATFDPHNGKVEVTAGKFKPGSMVRPLVATGVIFAVIGLVIGSGVF